MPVPLALEQQVAIAAVRRACALTMTVFNKLVAGETLVKGDKSPVTVADYAAQAVINTVLSHAFPDDPIIGEEDASDLRASSDTGGSDAAAALRARVVELADDILARPPLPPSSDDPSGIDGDGDGDGDGGDGGGERAEWGLGRRWGAEALLKAIDRGKHTGGRTGRFWTLDPIDGTKGFLRGGQYAVCLALLVDARVELGVIGCPNLPSEPPSPPSLQNTNTTTNTTNTTDTKSSEAQDRGALFIAVRGQGAYQLPLHPPTSTPNTSGTGTTSAQQQQPERRQRLRLRLSMPRLVPHDLSFLESYERAHAALDTNALVASRLGVHAQPVRMDSQAKYAALVRGDAGGGVYLRLPVALGKNGDGGGGGGGGGGGYQEKIWDHAPGSLLVEEAGGVISDYRGRPLDFGLGRTLGENFGVVAARGEVHAQVIEAVQAVLAESATAKI